MPPPKNETAEERRRRLDRTNAKRRANRLNETPEEKRERHSKRREKERLKPRVETPEQRRRHLDLLNERRKKKWLAASPSERREKAEKKSFQEMMKRVNMTEEEREERRRRDYFYRQANKEQLLRSYLSEEEKEAQRRRQREYVKNLTGDKKQRHRESVARAQKKQYEKIRANPEKWSLFQEKQRAYQRKRYAEETPEETRRRRRKDVVKQAKRRLRAQLEEESATSEEIERELRALGERMWKEFYPEGDFPRRGKRGRRRKVEETMAVAEGAEASLPPRQHEDGFLSPDMGEANTPEDSPPPSPLGRREEEEENVDTDSRAPALLEEACAHCHSSFSSTDHLRSHLVSSHPSKCWRCPNCAEVLLSPSELTLHYDNVHKDTPKRSEYHREWDAVNAVTNSKSEDRCLFVCIKCPLNTIAQFVRRSELFSHVREHHPTNFWPCENCQLLKYSEEAQMFHRAICNLCAL